MRGRVPKKNTGVMKMRTVHVTIQEGYPVYIGCGIIEQLPQLFEKQIITTNNKLVCITDSNVAPLYLRNLTDILSNSGYTFHTIIIPAGEASKNMTTIEDVIGQCLHYHLDRQSVILALGGGIVGDIAGFVAATYMRGIRYIHIPTTIIAHDSSVGGKVGVNHRLGKNVIGAFHQPQFVLFDVSFLKTLPREEQISGYAEVIKHALIRDEEFVKWLKANTDDLVSLRLPIVEKAIFRSCAIKASIVSCDEKEKGLRRILNYGHTIGHALETITKYNRYKHGEAIAIGMCGAAYLSDALYGKRVAQETTELLRAFGLPTQFTGSYVDDELLATMKHDKKRTENKCTFILSPEISQVEVVQVEEKWIKEALQKIRG